MVVIPGLVNTRMKGRIQCPNCSKYFTADAKEGVKELTVNCTYCNHQFIVHPLGAPKEKCKEDANTEKCTWEEYGEPRKTILSSMKPKTDKPTIATILLFLVFIIGISSSIVPGIFLETPTALFSFAGVEGSIIISYDEQLDFDQTSLELQIPSLNKSIIGLYENNSFSFSNLPLGHYTADLTIESNSTEFELYVIPIFTNSYELNYSTVKPNELSIIPHGFAWCTSILLIFSVICLIGVLSAWKRTYSDVAIIASIIGIFTIGFFFIGTILSIIALILLYLSRDEFNDGKKGKSF